MSGSDWRFALRRVARNPGFAALVAGTLALGIGATTTMFGVVRAVFLRPLGFPDEERIVTLWESDRAKGLSRQRVTPANFVDWEAEISVFEHLGTLPNWTGAPWAFNVAGKGGLERVHGIYASSGIFRAFGVAPMLGRTFGPEEDRVMGLRRVVLSHSFWRERFGGDRDAIGATLEVDTYRGGKFTVIGVMPEGFEFPEGARFWLSLGDWGGGPIPPRDAPARCCNWYTVFAKLKPGVTPEGAAAELTPIARRISARHPDAARVSDVEVVPLRESIVGAHRLVLFALAGAVGCVLLIGCANVANLLLARGVGRRREVETRMALGATRGRIARQLAAESLVLAGLGASAGVAIAVWGQSVIARLLAERVPLIAEARVDAAVLGFSALLALATGLICGWSPLMLGQSVEWGGRGATESRLSRRVRSALVVAEVALAVVLVAGTGLLLRTIANLRSVPVGFRTERLLAVTLDVTTSGLRGRGNAARFLDRLMPRIEALPGVRSAGLTTALPFESPLARQPITIEGRPVRRAAESPQVVPVAVSPGYFTTLGIALKSGRAPGEGDTEQTRIVVALNETAARRYFPNENPIGRRFAIGSSERFGSTRPVRAGEVEWHEVAGVVGDVRAAGFDNDVQPEVYYSYKQFPVYDPTIVVRTHGAPEGLAAAVRREIRDESAMAVVTKVRTMEQAATASIAGARLRAALVGLLSAIALALAALGLYGVVSYTVARRTAEIGVRMALGAEGPSIRRMIVGDGLRVTLIGIAVGTLGAIAAARSARTLLFGVAPFDWLTLAGTTIVLIVAACAASYLPARRAASVDPAAALRSE
jgi:predicted permease